MTDLVVRGICTLRPGVPGRSSRIRIVSVVGRFLEHSRIYRFENGGAPEFFIGSADLRPRNLRRRVELLVPVFEDEHKSTLDHVLGLYLNDPTAWELQPSGEYLRRAGGTAGDGVQAMLAAPERSVAEGRPAGASEVADPARTGRALPLASDEVPLAAGPPPLPHAD